MINPTKSQLENQMVCEFMFYSPSCTNVELRRFMQLQLWSIVYASRLNFTGGSLPLYLDKISTKAAKYSLKYGGLFSGIIYTSNYSIFGKSKNRSYINYEVRQPVWSFVCLNSTKLRIDCERKVYPDGLSNFTSYKFTFYLPKGSKPSNMTYIYNTSVEYVWPFTK